MLRWSAWRRWHQAWARYHHYRRRADQTPALPPAPEVGPPTTDLDGLWERLEPLLPRGKRTGRPYDHDRRVILAAILHVMETGCSWHALPERFPPWQTVYTQLRRWQELGIWNQIWSPRKHAVSEAEAELQL